jgi:hypothetical protein
MAYYGGSVIIQPKAARLTHDTAIFQMDPYCVVWLGNQSARTSTNHDGGISPHWNDTLTLFRNQEESVRFLIYDSDSVETDAFVAEGDFQFSTYKGEVFEKWIPLHYHERPAGELHVHIVMQPGAATQSPLVYPLESNITAGPIGYQQPIVIVEEPRHQLGDREQEMGFVQTAHQVPVQPYPEH